MESDHRTRSDGMIDVGLWVLTAACAATTLLFSFGAKPPGADLFSGADKVGHAIAYFTTTLSYLFAAVWRPGRDRAPFPRGWRWFLPAAVAGGAVIEILQGMTGRRSAEVSDLVAAAIGTFAALALHGLTRWQLVLRRAHADPRT